MKASNFVMQSRLHVLMNENQFLEGNLEQDENGIVKYIGREKYFFVIFAKKGI